MWIWHLMWTWAIFISEDVPMRFLWGENDKRWFIELTQVHYPVHSRAPYAPPPSKKKKTLLFCKFMKPHCLTSFDYDLYYFFQIQKYIQTRNIQLFGLKWNDSWIYSVILSTFLVNVCLLVRRRELLHGQREGRTHATFGLFSSCSG